MVSIKKAPSIGNSTKSVQVSQETMPNTLKTVIKNGVKQQIPVSRERHRRGEAPPGAHLPYLEALSTHPVFVEQYLPHRILLPSLRDRSALYVRGDSPEAARLHNWRDPQVE